MSICLEDRNVFARFDEIPSMTLYDIKETVFTIRTVRGSDYSPAIELSEQKDKLITATGETEKYSAEQANKVWLNPVYWFSRY